MEGRLTPNIGLVKPTRTRSPDIVVVNQDLDILDKAFGTVDTRLDVLEAASGGSTPTGPAGGDLAGTYPNPTLAAGAVDPSNVAAGTYAISISGNAATASSAPPSGAATGDLTGTYPAPQIASGVITDLDVNAANKDGLATTASLRTLGTGSQQAAAGNDGRLTNARTPTAHASTHAPGGTDALAVDAAAATGSLRTIGAGATAAAAGNHAHATYVTNPMTTAADLIVGGTAGAPGRLGVGAATQVLTVVGGVLTWATPASGGMTNPMTASDDLIVGGVAGAAVRKAKGADNQILTVVGGVLTWTDVVNASRATIASTLGMGVAPHADWRTDWDLIDFNAGRNAIAYDGLGLYYLQNSYHDGTNWRAVANLAPSSMVQPNNGAFVWNLDTAVAAGAIFTPTTRMQLTPTLLDVRVPATLTGGLSVTGGTLNLATLNLLTNPGLETWQRGPGPFTADQAYTADRWQIARAGTSTMSVSRDSNADTAGGTRWCAAVTYVHNTASNFQQVIEDVLALRGLTLTLRVRVQTTTANAVRLSIFDSVNGHRYSSFHTGSGAYETLTVTAPIAPGATALYAIVTFNASCTAYIDSATLVVGSAALAYAPLHSAEDAARCLRYYEVHGGVANGAPGLQGYGAAGTGGGYGVLFAVAKAVTPTLTKAGTWGVTNCGQPGGFNASMAGYLFSTTVTALGAYQVVPANATCTIVAEANV